MAVEIAVQFRAWTPFFEFPWNSDLGSSSENVMCLLYCEMGNLSPSYSKTRRLFILSWFTSCNISGDIDSADALTASAM